MWFWDSEMAQVTWFELDSTTCQSPMQSWVRHDQRDAIHVSTFNLYLLLGVRLGCSAILLGRRITTWAATLLHKYITVKSLVFTDISFTLNGIIAAIPRDAPNNAERISAVRALQMVTHLRLAYVHCYTPSTTTLAHRLRLAQSRKWSNLGGLSLMLIVITTFLTLEHSDETTFLASP